jgi:hypothetical protein
MRPLAFLVLVACSSSSGGPDEDRTPVTGSEEEQAPAPPPLVIPASPPMTDPSPPVTPPEPDRDGWRPLLFNGGFEQTTGTGENKQTFAWLWQDIEGPFTAIGTLVRDRSELGEPGPFEGEMALELSALNPQAICQPIAIPEGTKELRVRWAQRATSEAAGQRFLAIGNADAPMDFRYYHQVEHVPDGAWHAHELIHEAPTQVGSWYFCIGTYVGSTIWLDAFAVDAR